MKKSTDSHRNHRRRPGVRLLVAGAVVVASLTACSSGANAPKTTEVVAVDRTRSTSTSGTWPQEVAGIVKEQTGIAFTKNVDSVVLVSIGSNTADTAKVAAVSLHSDCSNANVCHDDQVSIGTQLGTAAGKVAATPVGKAGTDIIAALNTAKAICGRDKCVITLISDGADSRLFGAGSADELVAQHIGEFPKLTGTTVHLIGLGADESNSAAVERIKAFWVTALTRAGAVDIQISRSL